jgi:ATP-dependent RNA helicase DDX41
MSAIAASSAAAASNSDEEENYEEYIPVAKRRAMEAERLRQLRLSKSAPASAVSSLPMPPPPPLLPAQTSVPDAAAKPSLLVKATQLKRAAPEVTATEQRIQQEKEVIENLSDNKSLRSVREIAKGIIYTEPIQTGWKPPLRLRRMPLAKANEFRRKWHIIVDGDDIPPPARDFRDLRLPEPMLRKLRERGIVQPTPIQVQGLPVVLSGRDMIGIAFTGSGKTLVFVLPLIMVALQEESLMPIVPGEGPFGMIICPSRELAKQTYDVIEQFLIPLKEAGYPEIRHLLCIGGVDMRTQLDVLKKGVHIVVATPGRLKDLLAKKKMNLDNCRCVFDVAETSFHSKLLGIFMLSV